MSKFLVLVGATLASAHAVAVTPVEKVTALLTQLKTDVEEEGKAEAETYDAFACFCKDKSTTISANILSNQDSVESLSADLEELTATKDGKQTELLAKKQEQERLTSDLHDTTVELEKTKAEYDAKSVDLTKALASLAAGITALENAKTEPSDAGLLALKHSIKESVTLADALKLVEAGPVWHKAMMFVQQGTGVDPADPEYKYHSHGIIEIMQKLQTELTSKKTETDEEWERNKQSLDDTIANLNEQLTLVAAAITTLSDDIDTLTSSIASTRSDLVETESTLKENKLYIEDLTKLCETRAKEWDQRSQLRSSELDALTKAIEIISGKVAEADAAVNERALLLQRASPLAKGAAAQAKAASMAASKAASFLQLRAARRGLLLGRGAQRLQAQQAERALSVLRLEGGRLNSPVLLDMAARIAADPLGKVKGLIQDLIEKLIQQATEEATKKGFCDTEVGKATQERTFRHDAAKKLNSQLRTLEAKKDALEADVVSLTGALQALREALADATAARAAQKAQNAAELKTAREGAEAVSGALGLLRRFYQQSAKAKAPALLQASPVDQDAPSAGFSGAYKGSQDSSTGIIGLLEVIKSDFDRTIETTTRAEAEAESQFVEFERTSQADIASKETSLELTKQELKTTISKIDVKTKDLQTNVNLLDAALRELEDLRPVCIDTGMSYATRVAKRDEEIAALKKALCALDTDDVEEECK